MNDASQIGRIPRAAALRVGCALLLLGVTTAAAKQLIPTGSDVDVGWFTVEGGGGVVMTGGGPGNEFTVVGSAGQHDSGRMFGAGDTVEVIGGFGAVYTANEVHWAGGTSGSFNDGVRWDEGVAPDTYDTTVFDVDALLIAVSMPQTTYIGRLFVLDGNQVRLDFNNTNLILLDDVPNPQQPHIGAPSLVIAQRPDPDFVELRIRNNSTVPHGLEARSVSIADVPGSRGRLVVTRPTQADRRTSFTNVGNLWVGRRGEGLMEVALGSQTLSVGPISIATDPDTEGRIFVHGAGSLWTTESGIITDQFTIGDEGFGVMEIHSGASVVTSGFDELTLGLHPLSYGRVVIDGPESEWEVNQPIITVGGGGTGQILLFNDGTLTHSPDMLLGVTPTVVLGPNGWLEGAGTVRADVQSFGHIRPIGLLTIDGEYEQAGGGSLTGSLHLELGGSNHLHVTKQVRLGGGLFVTLAPGYNPNKEESFTFLTAGLGLNPAFNRFHVAFMPGLLNNRFLAVQYGGAGLDEAGSVSISVGELGNVIGFGKGSPLPLGGTATAVAVGHFNDDEHLDIAITITGSDPSQQGHVLILFNNGEGGFSSSTQIPVDREPSAIAVGDFTGNGADDIAVTNEVDATVSILLNDGFGSFTVSTVPVDLEPSGIAAGDFRGGGVIDLAVVNAGSNNVHILHNQHNNTPGVFAPVQTVAVGANPQAIAAGDLTGANGVDLVVANFDDGTISLLGNNGDGTFLPAGAAAPVGQGPNAVIIDDLDNDKDLDILVGNSGSGTISVLLNIGGGAFAPPVDLPLNGEPLSIAAFDMNNSNAPDLAIVVDDIELGLVVRILRNDLFCDPDTDMCQLAFTHADDLGEGESPVLVTSGDVTGDGAEDLITINAVTGPPMAGGAQESSLSIRPNLLGPPTNPADLNGDNVVDVLDLLILLDAWGACPKSGDCPADFNGDDSVDVLDLLFLLDHWG